MSFFMVFVLSFGYRERRASEERFRLADAPASDSGPGEESTPARHGPFPAVMSIFVASLAWAEKGAAFVGLRNRRNGPTIQRAMNKYNVFLSGRQEPVRIDADAFEQSWVDGWTEAVMLFTKSGEGVAAFKLESIVGIVPTVAGGSLKKVSSSQ